MSDSLEKRRRELFDISMRIHRSRPLPPKPEGVTTGEAFVILGISMMKRAGRPVRSGHLAHFAHTTPSSLSQMLKSLEKKGLIERTRSGDDCRGVTIDLTEEGRRIDDESRRLHDEYMERLIAHLGEDDTRELIRILRKGLEFSERERAEGAAAASQAEGDCPCA